MTRQTYGNEDDDTGGGAAVDAMLREHFAAALDDQVGRAGRAFERHVAATAQPDIAAATTRLVIHPTPSTARRSGLIVTLGTGLAASVAALFTAAMMWHAAPTPVAGTTRPHVTPTLVGPRDTPPAAAVHAPSPGLRVGDGAAVTRAADATFHFQMVGESVSHHAQVEGLVVIDDRTPARIVRERAVERTQWVDEHRGLRIETVVPREDVRLIQLETH